MSKAPMYFVDSESNKHKVVAKAKSIEVVLSNLAIRNERILRVPLQQWMGFANAQIKRDLASKFKKSVTSKLTDWQFIEEQGKKTLKPASLKIMQSGGNAAYKQLAISGSFDVLNVRAVKAAEKFTAKLVKDVTANTKKGIRTYISAGVKAGKAMPTIAKELRPLVGLTKLQTKSIINYRKTLGDLDRFSPAQIDKKVLSYTNKTHRRRMENIARTETARAQNIGYCQGLEDVGVVEAELRISAVDYCDDCLVLDKTRYPVGEAGAILPVHPRCRCAMLPVVDDKVISETLHLTPPELPGAMSSEEGLAPWKSYLNTHAGEKPSSGLLYDWYKIRYETTGKITGGTKKYLRSHAAKYEATSVRISKPISGLEDIIKPIRALPGPKPINIPVPKPKKVPSGLLGKSHFQTQSAGWEERLAIHKASLQERIGVDLKALKVHRTDLPEYKEALTKFESALKSFTAPTSKVDDISRTYYPAKGDMKKAMRNINAFYDKVEEIGCDDVIKFFNQQGIGVNIYKGAYRANAYPNQFRILMAASDNRGVYFHEIGHLLESNNRLKGKTYNWVAARGGGRGKSIPYSKIGSWSSDTQNAYKDKFINPYVGKFYRDGSTEVMSMGMQQFTSYGQMLKFAKKDFDHFSLIHGILTGAI